MAPAQRAILIVGLVLVGLAVVGVVARRRYRLWWFFAAYLVAVLASTTLQAASPARFVTPDFWQAKETAYTVLRFGMATEVGLRVFGPFPGALATARRLVFVILAATLVAVISAPAGESYRTFVGELQPRILNGSIWLFTAIAGLILWYRLPVHGFHKSVLLSYVPYVLVFTVLISYLGRAGWQRGVALQYVNQIAYVVLLAYWNVAIWRRDAGPARGEAPPPGPQRA